MIARALPLLVGALLRRLLREDRVVRSLAFPGILAAGTLVLSLVTVSVVQPRRTVAVPANLDPALEASLSQAGFVPLISGDPAATVQAGDAWAGTDGRAVWWSFPSPDNMVLEAQVRRHVDAPWTPHGEARFPRAERTAEGGRVLVRFIGAIFVLYGVVFGAGMLIRDRDEGTLEAELSLPVPPWIHGLARWMAGSLVLGVFFAVSASLCGALVGLAEAPAVIRNGVAAGSAAVATGLLQGSRASRTRGFSSALARGMFAATVLLLLGGALPELGRHLPIASLLTRGSGWTPLGLAVILGSVCAWTFGRRAVS